MAVFERYTLTETDHDALRERFRIADNLSYLALLPRYNVAPGQEMPVITRDDDNHLGMMRWGLLPACLKETQTGSKMITTKAESLAEKPYFRTLLHSRRCLVPATGFIRWQHRDAHSRPYLVTVADAPLFAFAGLYDEWAHPYGRLIRSYTVITVEDGAQTRDRLPAILARRDESAWLAPDRTEREQVLLLLGAYPADLLHKTAISPLIANARIDRPEVLFPVKM